jgi:RHS repeat-associated protein
VGSAPPTGSRLNFFITAGNVTCQSAQEALYFISPDQLNTPRAVADNTGKVIWQWDGEPFGSSRPYEDPDGDGQKFTLNLRFPGQYFDVETGLHYNYFRDYDPGTARYVESDPIGLSGGINTYAYVRGNPVGHMDPTGLACVAVGDRVTCAVPGGPTVTFPRPPGWPDFVGPNSTNYHSYNEWVNTSGVDKKCLEDYLRNHPTPGSPSPATPDGTDNDATPKGWEEFGPSPTRSYVTTYNGNQVVVNVTMPTHPLFPGYVVRNVESGPYNNQINNYGEGTGWEQAWWWPGARPINNVWHDLVDDAIKACRCQK